MVPAPQPQLLPYAQVRRELHHVFPSRQSSRAHTCVAGWDGHQNGPWLLLAREDTSDPVKPESSACGGEGSST